MFNCDLSNVTTEELAAWTKDMKVWAHEMENLGKDIGVPSTKTVNRVLHSPLVIAGTILLGAYAAYTIVAGLQREFGNVTSEEHMGTKERRPSGRRYVRRTPHGRCGDSSRGRQELSVQPRAVLDPPARENGGTATAVNFAACFAACVDLGKLRSFSRSWHRCSSGSRPLTSIRSPDTIYWAQKIGYSGQRCRWLLLVIRRQDLGDYRVTEERADEDRSVTDKMQRWRPL